MPDPRDAAGSAEAPPVLAYFGPAGTFTEMALLQLPEAATAEHVACATVPAALEAVRRGRADAAMVPLENSVEGPVTVTLDELAGGEPLVVVREVLLPVSFALLGRPGQRLEDVTTVATHPHAAAQVRRWLRERLPDAEVVHASSTAAAAAELARDGTPGRVAVSAPIAAQRYGLEVLAGGLQDVPGAVTRFVLVTRVGPPPLPTGRDRTTVVAFIAADRPGALLEVLTEFAVRGVNLSRIESRPTGAGLGRYCFSIDAEGHVDEVRVGEALTGLRRVCAGVRFLGSYPRATSPAGGPGPGPGPAGSTDDEFRDAAAWLARVRDGRPS